MESLMPGPQVDQLVEQIRKALPRTKDLDAAVQEVRDGLEILMPGLATSLSDEISEARQIVELDFEKVEILYKHSVFRKRPDGTSAPDRPISIGLRFGISF